MTEILLKCSCGLVQGMAHDVTANSGTRVVCYCDDCQAFARYLGNEDVILDQYGGTDIFQLTPSQVTFEQGVDHLRCVRLSEKGLYRWYTGCCKTPIGNTISATVALVGIIHNIMDDQGQGDKNLDPVRAYVQGNFAKDGLPAERYNKGFPLGLTLRVIGKILMGKIKGKHRPSPFFKENGDPVVEPEIVASK